MLNCWEVMECGYGPYSVEAVCPAAKAFQFHGVNEGDNGGRLCWSVLHTRCQGQVQDTTNAKECHCADCAFYQQVKREQGSQFVLKPAPMTQSG